MNGRERITRILSGQPVDRPPLVPVLSLYGARLSGQDSETYYTDPAAYVIGQSAVMDLIEPDVIFSPFVFTAEGVAFGGQDVFLAHHPPNMKSFAVKEKADIARLRVPDPHEHPRLRFVLEAVARMRDQLSHRAMICAPCPGPADLPALLMGIDAWFEILLFDEPTRTVMLDLAVDFYVRWANALLAAGADFVGTPVAFGNTTLVTRSQAEQVILPVLRRAFADVKGPIVFHHAGGSLGAYLSLYADLPNVAGYLMDETDSLADARRDVGPGKLLLGGLNATGLAGAQPRAVLDRATRILEERAADPLFFLATSGADVPWQTEPAVLLALRDAVDSRASVPSAPPSSRTTLVSCSIFRPYLDGMEWQGAGPDRTILVDSVLHVVPDELDTILSSIIDYERGQGRRVLVAYGDCTSHLVERCQGPGVRRVPMANCCAILVGPERYRALRRGEIFAFLPEWAGRWRSILQASTGGDSATSHEIFRFTNRGLVFLESEQARISAERREEIATALALPASVERVTGQSLQAELRSALQVLREE
jgi:uroporphyrinogen decarboxylase